MLNSSLVLKCMRRSFAFRRYNYYSLNYRCISIFKNRQIKQYKFIHVSQRNVFIEINQTPNVLSQKFIPSGYNILPIDKTENESTTNKTLDLASYKDAMNKSGLARELFTIEGVKNVFLTTEYLTVTVDDTSKWQDTQGQIVGIINDYLLSNKPILEDTFDINEQISNDNNYDDEDDDTIAIIRELIDTRIRPNVQYDGGDVVFKGFDHETGKLSLQLVGACKGCESSAETLHNGIERMLKFYVPEVSYVEEFFDEEEERLQQISKDAFDKVNEKLNQDKQNQDK
eukprot:170218_1